MKIYLDDKRSTPEGWVRCYWPDEVIAYLEAGNVEELSLDHDLGNDARGTGYDVIRWIEEKVYTSNYVPPKRIRLHTQNPEGKKNMKAGLQSIYRALDRRKAENQE